MVQSAYHDRERERERNLLHVICKFYFSQQTINAMMFLFNNWILCRTTQMAYYLSIPLNLFTGHKMMCTNSCLFLFFIFIFTWTEMFVNHRVAVAAHRRIFPRISIDTRRISKTNERSEKKKIRNMYMYLNKNMKKNCPKDWFLRSD